MVTGASSGIGLAAAVELARRGDRVVLVGRDPARLAGRRGRYGRPRAGRRRRAYRADFASLDDVRALADAAAAAYDRIDVLANNAGAHRAARRVTTVDGLELTIQANHLAPFLLTNLLRERLGRMVTTASGAHRVGALDPRDLNRALQRYRPMRAYGTSKQANVLFAAEAARRWPRSSPPRTTRASCAPGSAARAAWSPGACGTRRSSVPPRRARRRWSGWRTPTPRLIVNGGYYHDHAVRRPMARATDRALASALWEASERAVGLSFSRRGHSGPASCRRAAGSGA